MTQIIELPPFFAAESFSSCTKSKYCNLHQVREQCAESILDFYRYNKSSFGDCLELKSSGIDFWSRKSEEKLLEYLQERGMDKDTILLLKDTIVNYSVIELPSM